MTATEPYATMKESMQIGEKKGVRLAHALYAVAGTGKSGDDAKLLMRSVLMRRHPLKINLQIPVPSD